MRHAEDGGPGFSLAHLGGLHWRGWARPARRARQVASLAFVGSILTLGGATTQAHTGQVETGQFEAGQTLPDAQAAAEAGDPVRPIAAWTEFCRRMPQDCTHDPGQPSAVTLTPAVWRTLQGVNRRVNARIRPITDQAHWGVVDRWDYPDDGSGDCEDYQLLKRRMLAERGLPRRALLMTVVIDDIDEGHAVLTVRTDRGDVILDNKTDAIRPWRRTGYRFIKREGQNGRGWVSLEEPGRGKGGGAQVATAEP